MADTLESLEIEVKHSATGVADEIKQVTSAVRSLGRALGNVVPMMKAFRLALDGGIININDNSTRQVADTINNIKTGASSAGKAMKDASSGVSALSKAASKSLKPLGTFVSSLKRIAFYRFIRSIIKAITEAFQEGQENAYKFSSGIATEGRRFSAALDSMSSAGMKMKNQLGSYFISLLSAIAPIVNQLISLITKLADFWSQVFAAFTGGTYLKATDTFKQWADTASSGAAATKEWKNQLLGFDEINKLEAPSNGGKGGGSAIDPSSMFVDTPLDKWAQSLKDFIDMMEFEIKDVFFKWDNLTPEDIAKKAIVGLSGFLGGAAGFMIGGVPGAIVGTLLGVSIGLVIDGLVFNNDGVINQSELMSMLKTALFALCGGMIGFVIGGVPGALLGAVIGIGVSALIESIKFTVKDTSERKKYKTDLDWFVCGVLGLPTDEELKQWGTKALEWLGEGFKDLKTDLEALFIQPVKDAWNEFKEWWKSLSLPTFHINLPHIGVDWIPVDSIISRFLGITALPSLSINWYAQGGFPEDGLFFANHNELVGQFSNGKTAVANNAQITEGIASAVYDAFTSAMSNTNSNEQQINVKVYLDSREIRAGQQRLSRAMG